MMIPFSLLLLLLLSTGHALIPRADFTFRIGAMVDENPWAAEPQQFPDTIDGLLYEDDKHMLPRDTEDSIVKTPYDDDDLDLVMGFIPDGSYDKTGQLRYSSVPEVEARLTNDLVDVIFSREEYIRLLNNPRRVEMLLVIHEVIQTQSQQVLQQQLFHKIIAGRAWQTKYIEPMLKNNKRERLLRFGHYLLDALKNGSLTTSDTTDFNRELRSVAFFDRENDPEFRTMVDELINVFGVSMNMTKDPKTAGDYDQTDHNSWRKSLIPGTTTGYRDTTTTGQLETTTTTSMPETTTRRYEDTTTTGYVSTSSYSNHDETTTTRNYETTRFSDQEDTTTHIPLTTEISSPNTATEIQRHSTIHRYGTTTPRYTERPVYVPTSTPGLRETTPRHSRGVAFPNANANQDQFVYVPALGQNQSAPEDEPETNGTVGEQKIQRKSARTTTRDEDGLTTGYGEPMDYTTGQYQDTTPSNMPDTTTGRFQGTTPEGWMDTTTGAYQDITSEVYQDTTTGRYQDTTTGEYQDTTTGTFQDGTPRGWKDTTTGRYQDTTTGDYQDSTTEGFEDSTTGEYQDTTTGQYQDITTGGYQDTTTEEYQDITTGDYQDFTTEGFEDSTTGSFQTVTPRGWMDTTTGGYEDTTSEGYQDTTTGRFQASTPEGWMGTTTGRYQETTTTGYDEGDQDKTTTGYEFTNNGRDETTTVGHFTKRKSNFVGTSTVANTQAPTFAPWDIDPIPNGEASKKRKFNSAEASTVATTQAHTFAPWDIDPIPYGEASKKRKFNAAEASTVATTQAHTFAPWDIDPIPYGEASKKRKFNSAEASTVATTQAHTFAPWDIDPIPYGEASKKRKFNSAEASTVATTQAHTFAPWDIDPIPYGEASKKRKFNSAEASTVATTQAHTFAPWDIDPIPYGEASKKRKFNSAEASTVATTQAHTFAPWDIDPIPYGEASKKRKSHFVEPATATEAPSERSSIPFQDVYQTDDKVERRITKVIATPTPIPNSATGAKNNTTGTAAPMAEDEVSQKATSKQPYKGRRYPNFAVIPSPHPTHPSEKHIVSRNGSQHDKKKESRISETRVESNTTEATTPMPMDDVDQEQTVYMPVLGKSDEEWESDDWKDGYLESDDYAKEKASGKPEETRNSATGAPKNVKGIATPIASDNVGPEQMVYMPALGKSNDGWVNDDDSGSKKHAEAGKK